MRGPGFRFRAQAALDLRVRDEEAAQRELARAQRDREAARLCLDAAIDAAARARVEASHVTGRARSTDELVRYRFWILRLDHERAVQASVLVACEATVRTAEEALVAAHRRRESLERFRTRAWDAHAAASAAAERQAIDELATRRFAVGQARFKGAHS